MASFYRHEWQKVAVNGRFFEGVSDKRLSSIALHDD
jgi:hypothetical protein